MVSLEMSFDVLKYMTLNIYQINLSYHQFHSQAINKDIGFQDVTETFVHHKIIFCYL